MKKIFITTLFLSIIALIGITCTKSDCNQQMLDLLVAIKHANEDPDNSFSPSAKLVYMDSLLLVPHTGPNQISYCKYLKGNILMELGREDEALRLYKEAAENTNPFQANQIIRELAI